MAVYRRTFTWNPTVDTAVYTAGDCIVTGAVEIENLMSDTGEVTLRGISGCEDGGQAPSLTILFFDREPGATLTANSAPTWGASDDAYFMGIARIVGGDWYTSASHSFMSLGEMGVCLRGQMGTNPYIVVLADSAYDATADNDLRLEFHFEAYS